MVKKIVLKLNSKYFEDVLNGNPMVFDVEYLISTSHKTHNAIHYGDEDLLEDEIIVRKKFDTCPWRH